MPKINYEGRTFVVITNTGTGEVTSETVFHYHQEGNIVWAEYSGGSILQGHLIAIADADGCLEMRYHHVNTMGDLMTGICRTVPEILSDGRLRLHENWQWTSGDRSTGESILEEKQIQSF